MNKISRFIPAALALGLGLLGCENQATVPVVDEKTGPVSALTGTEWRSVNFPTGQSAKDIGAGGLSDRDIFAVGTPSGTDGWQSYKVEGADGSETWSTLDRYGDRVDVDKLGRKFIISTGDRLYYGDNGNWTQCNLPQGELGLSDVGVGTNAGDSVVIWALGVTAFGSPTSRKIYYSGNLGATWFPPIANKAAKRIDVDNQGKPWIVGHDNLVWKLKPDGTWESKGLLALDIGVGAQGSVFALAISTGQVNQYTGTGTTWTADPTGMTGTNITVDLNGRPWITRSNGSVSTRNY